MTVESCHVTVVLHSTQHAVSPDLSENLAYQGSSPTKGPRLPRVLAYQGSSPTKGPRLPRVLAYQGSSPTKSPLETKVHLTIELWGLYRTNMIE